MTSNSQIPIKAYAAIAFFASLLVLSSCKKDKPSNPVDPYGEVIPIPSDATAKAHEKDAANDIPRVINYSLPISNSLGTVYDAFFLFRSKSQRGSLSSTTKNNITTSSITLSMKTNYASLIRAVIVYNSKVDKYASMIKHANLLDNNTILYGSTSTASIAFAVKDTAVNNKPAVIHYFMTYRFLYLNNAVVSWHENTNEKSY